MEPVKGINYYINEDGFMVFTEKYLLENGVCCGFGCIHCPFDFKNVDEPRRSELRKIRSMNP